MFYIVRSKETIINYSPDLPTPGWPSKITLTVLKESLLTRPRPQLIGGLFLFLANDEPSLSMSLSLLIPPQGVPSIMNPFVRSDVLFNGCIIHSNRALLEGWARNKQCAGDVTPTASLTIIRITYCVGSTCKLQKKHARCSEQRHKIPGASDFRNISGSRSQLIAE